MAEAADILGLDALLDRTPAELSGGQRQRVAMGRAIVRNPDAFLFDEPLSNLDAKLRGQMRAEIKKLHQKVKTTVVYVTHDQVEAMTLADRIVVMNDGHIEQVGTPMEVFNHPLTTFVATFIGSPPMNLLPGTIDGESGASGRWHRRSRARPAAANACARAWRCSWASAPMTSSPSATACRRMARGPSCDLTVDLAEPLGMESLIYTRHRRAGGAGQALRPPHRRTRARC